MAAPRIERVLAAYAGFAAPRDVRPMAAGQGFSGAEVWRIETMAGSFALRAWHPHHPSPERLSWIHAVLAHVDRTARRAGTELPLPLPLRMLTGPTFLESDGHCWELAPWLPGEPDQQNPPCPERITAAMTTLARFHQAAVGFSVPCPGWESTGRLDHSPGIGERRQQLARWMSDDWASLTRAIRQGAPDWPRFCELASEWLALARIVAARVASQLSPARHSPTPLQPCLRDIKRDHVLFTGDTVTGLVDFGALRPETVAADLARLVGSFAADCPLIWRDAIADYETICPLSTYERWLIEVFDESGLLLGGGNWVEWVMIQRQVFPDRDAVESRLKVILRRLTSLAERR